MFNSKTYRQVLKTFIYPILFAEDDAANDSNSSTMTGAEKTHSQIELRDFASYYNTSRENEYSLLNTQNDHYSQDVKREQSDGSDCDELAPLLS